ncbi:hypothetical protein V496_01886 [Pseudogymnoascus sp. VKM F-4515 (FW-2607)]|nr:hypothetical protein V496_01886 [Pseudogymnoascus sp. VKM F-4515 (FW-2607)]
MVSLQKRGGTTGSFVILAFVFPFIISLALADCSKTKPCASGCCSQFGFCGVGDEFCGAGCLSSCDFQLGCDAKRPCASGCCNKFGFCGLGPDYCDTKVCVAGCGSKSYCDPGYGPKWAEVAHCPLNVCCSKWGFCGLTEEFCGDKKVKRPSCDALSGPQLQNVVGYYEGWSTARPCNTFHPEQIPLGVYTHINFAFATIDPKTFEIRPGSSYDIDLYKRVTALKRQDPDLKVFIAIGGWTFNDPGPTERTFSDLAASETNQRAFFQSLVSFLATYDFDGVDIDWEYPVTKDRNGREQDFANFPKFIRNLQGAIQGSGRFSGVTVTLPASYWYLRHFDIKELVKYVEFFNIMSYDMHGPWEKGNIWTGEFLNGHTNLTEISGALDLMWRNDIPPSKVVLGLAFYARAFTVANVNCKTPGCLFASGAKPGRCSHEISILLNSEIDEIVAEKGLQPVLYKDAAVKVVTWDDQWLAYDDEETLSIKADFARSMCLGGVMVWAISHDTVAAKYTKALAKAARRDFVAINNIDATLPGGVFGELPSSGVPAPTGYKVYTRHQQCKWMGCHENCPSGWQWVRRTGPGSQTKTWEGMSDESACDGDGQHNLCCPPTTEQPQCGWYGFNGGKCDPTGACPFGFKEIGSLSKHCHNGKYQTACCSVILNSEGTPIPPVEGLDVYETCEWGAWPKCDDNNCITNYWMSTTLSQSSTGSGGSVCNFETDYRDRDIYEKRDYCCDTSNINRRWQSCYIPFGYLGGAAGRENSRFCDSTCPSSTPMCCIPGLYSSETVEFPEATAAREVISSYLHQPTCPKAIELLQRRSLAVETIGHNSTALVARSSSPRYDNFVLLLTIAFRARHFGQTEMMETVVDEELRAADLATVREINDWRETDPRAASMSSEEIAKAFACDPITVTCMVKVSKKCPFCKDNTCGGPNDSYKVPDINCAGEKDYDDGDATPRESRVTLLRRHEGDAAVSLREIADGGEEEAYHELSKRADSASGEITDFTYRNRDTGATKPIYYRTQPYYHSRTWPPEHESYYRMYDYENEADCANAKVINIDAANPIYNNRHYQTEHLIEFQGMKAFFLFLGARTLPSGLPSRVLTPVPLIFFTDFFAKPVLRNLTPLPGGSTAIRIAYPCDRIMEAVGSVDNNENFVHLIDTINGMKMRAWAGKKLASDDRMEIMIKGAPGNAIVYIRRGIAVINYLNHPNVNGHLAVISNQIRAQLVIISNEWNSDTTRHQINLAADWDEWIRDQLSQPIGFYKIQRVKRAGLYQLLTDCGLLPQLQEGAFLCRVLLNTKIVRL